MSSATILSTFQSTFPGLYSQPSGAGSEEQAGQLASDIPEAKPDDKNDAYNARIAGITSKFEKMRQSADQMEQYLRAAAEEAKEAEARALAKADEDFTPAWRNVGLPLKPSHLQLDNGAMSGARLVNPKAIVREYQAIKEREVLNPPPVAEYADTSAKPNYLKGTHALTVRKGTTLSPERLDRMKQISSKALTWHLLSEGEVAAKMDDAEERRRQLALKMPRAQFDLEKKVIQSMHHKLAFLRNPRYPLPPAVRTLLDTKPPSQRWAMPRAAVTQPGAAPPIKANMTAKPDTLFVVEPEEVTFTDYAVGRVYEQLVRVRNVTAVSRSLRVFPPASQYFHVSLPRYPGDTGVLAPGMAAELTLRFCPDSLGDYEDALGIDTVGRRLTVPLRAQRPPPSLTLPEEIDMGQVVIGNVKTEQVAFKNLGGQGRFRIVPEAAWPDFAEDAPTDRAVIGPFKMWPLFFEMAPGEELALNVSYEPTDWGNSEERLVLVCDNCQVKTFSLLGNAVAVDVLLHSVDGRMLEPRELDLPLWFGEVAPGSGFAKTVSVRNTTKLPFAFEWALTRFPQVQHKRRANEPLQTEQQYDEDQDDEGHVMLVDNKALRGTPHGPPGTGLLVSAPASFTTGPRPVVGTGGGASVLVGGVQQSGPVRLLPGADTAGTPWGVITGSGAHGPDPLALGAVVESVFSIVPERGVLQPGEVMEFQVTFTPPACERFERWAQLRVDRTPVAPGGGTGTAAPTTHAAVAAAANCDVLVAEVGLEGLGCPVALDVSPRLLALPGTLMPGQRAERTVQLRNPTRAQVTVRAAANHPAVCVSPATLVVPPLGGASLAVTITAPDTPGPLRAGVGLEVEHGQPIPLEVRATVGASVARLVTTRLDFGLVRLGGKGERPLVIRNSSKTCSTPWSIRELTPAVIAAEKAKLLRMQLMQSSRLLDPAAAAAAMEALGQDEEEEGGEEPGADNPASQAAALAAADERRAVFAAGRRRGGVGSTGSAGSGAGPPPSTTHMTLEPSSGVLGPGEEVTLRCTCHALTDGRSRSILQLRSGPGGHMECLEALVCVVTPHCVLDRPIVDLGCTFVGVQVRQSLSMANLSLLPVEFRWAAEAADEPEAVGIADLKIRPERGSLAPGEEVEVQVRYTPRFAGRSLMYGVCEVDGAPAPLGFRMSSTIQGLDVTYELMSQEQHDARQAAAREAAARGGRAGGGGAEAYVRRGKGGAVQVEVEAFQGLTHLPQDLLARVAAGAGPAHRESSAASVAHGSSHSQPQPQELRPPPQHAGLPPQGVAPLTWPPPAPEVQLVADFGRAVPLGETRQMYLVITNRTAMHTSVRTWLDTFGVEDAAKFARRHRASQAGAAAADAKGRRESSLSLPGSEGREGAPRIRISKYTPIRLAADNEKTAPFHSARGNEMMATRRLQEEAEHALGRKGLAVSVAPPESTLEPWSRLVLALSCFNDMVGSYRDTLHVKVGDLPPRAIPVLVGVAGSPLAVQRERVLLRGLRERAAETDLDWGQQPAAVPAQRTFYVFNTGSLDMDLSWQTLRYNDSPDIAHLPPTTDCGAGGTGTWPGCSLYGGPGRLRDTRAAVKMLDVTLAPDEPAGSVRLVSKRHADPAAEPFIVEPAQAVIKGGASARFTVTFSSPAARAHRGLLLGTQRLHGHDAPPTPQAGPGGEDAGEECDAAPPLPPLQQLRVELTATVSPSRLEPDGAEELAWTVHSIHNPASHPSFVRSITLSNTQACPQLFSLGVSGPWDVVAAVPSVPQDPTQHRGTSQLLQQPLAATLGGGSGAAEGGPLYLPPRESVDVTLRYVPGKGDLEALPVRFAAMQARQRTVETTADYRNSGTLSVSFANGESQALALEACMLHPRLEVKPGKLDFGRIHLQSQRTCEVVLSNPTHVDAAWAVTVEGHKPRFPQLPGAGAAASSAHAAERAAERAAVAAEASAGASATPRSGGGAGAEGAAASRTGSAASSRAGTGTGAGAAGAAPHAAALTPQVSGLGHGGTGGVPPPPSAGACVGPAAPATGIIAEARIGPFLVRPASGVLPGRGLRLPPRQTVSITFAPTGAELFEGELIFAVLRGKEARLEIDGAGSTDEADEHKGRLAVI